VFEWADRNKQQSKRCSIHRKENMEDDCERRRWEVNEKRVDKVDGDGGR